MKWTPITKNFNIKKLKYPVLLLDVSGAVLVFLNQDDLIIHLKFGIMGLCKDDPFTHWAHFDLPSKEETI